MPRKTRKQKAKAKIRRAQTANGEPVSELVKGEFEFEPKLFSRDLEAKKMDKGGEKSLFFYDSRLIVHDLAKTLIIALGIFSLEIVVYLVWFK